MGTTCYVSYNTPGDSGNVLFQLIHHFTSTDSQNQTDVKHKHFSNGASKRALLTLLF